MNSIARRFFPRGGDVDMTQGSISRHLIMFALPLLIGNIFQQLYNTADTWVVGNYVSNAAYSAVGSVGPIINMLIGFFTGLASGAGVIISQNYGAKCFDKVKKAVHTSAVMTLGLGVLFTVVGILMTPAMLRFMKTPDEVFPEAKSYLTIYFAGVIGLMIYNMGSGILRAVGDSVKPFFYLVVSAVTNTVLDLLFVLQFHMGVEGVPYATIIAQGLSALLTVIELLRTKTCIHLSVCDLGLDMPTLGQIFRFGLPAAIQMSVTSFSNVFVQSYINYFGADFMSGWTSYSKIDQVVLLPMQSLALASTTFVGQNLGVHDEPRAKRGVRIAFLMSVISTVLLMLPVMIFARPLAAFFNAEPAVVTYSAFLLRLISPFYVLCCVNQVYAGALRGAGDSRMPMIIMLGSFVVFRQIYLFICSLVCNNIYTIALAYPAGWIVASAITLLYFHKVGLHKYKVVD